MPSSRQLRYEALANAAERAMMPAPPVLLFTFTSGRAPLRVRVQNQAGGYVEFQLLEVDLDDGMLIGRGSAGDVRLPLGNVRRIWRRQGLLRRSVPLWLGVVFAGAVSGALIDVFAGWSVSYGAGAGAVFGAFGAFWLVSFVDKLPVHKWITMYDEAAA